MSDTAGLLIGFFLTLFVFSYAWRDNPLYRLAVHLLVGVSAAYAAVTAVRAVIWPVVVEVRLGRPAGLAWLAPLLLAGLLLFKLHRHTAWLGDSALALLFAAGAAVALVGAIQGTLWPLVTAASGDPYLDVLAALLTACALLYFQFTGAAGRAQPPRWRRVIAKVGQIVLTIALAALFAGLLQTSLVLLSDRVSFLAEAVRSLGRPGP
ncbi:MAG: hypothetical protein AB1791_14940 [Chloroflexota bacterium]